MIRLWVVSFFVILFPVLVSAQITDEFTIKVFGGTDSEAPSTTTIQSIVPVTTSQIDISWATSTDNYAVFGYVVSRDGVPIATTTATFYSDVGLAASTTYSYSVQAFDGTPNYASSSVPAFATTPAIPPVITEPVVSGTAVRVVLDSFSLRETVVSADLEVNTRRNSRIEIRYGETSSLEKGYLAGARYLKNHTFQIGDLEPDTKYYYEVIGYTPSGMQTVLQTSSFTTLSDLPPEPPANVNAFSAQVDGSSVTLSWETPVLFPSDSSVRVVRSHFYYPAFINDGFVVYEGNGQGVRDLGVLDIYDRVYYTAFVIDGSGQVSSGAITQVFSFATGAAPSDIGSRNQSEVPGNFSDVNPDPLELIADNAEDMPNPSDIQIIQGDTQATFASSSIELFGNESFTISVPSNKIKGDFKTLIATLADPRGSGKTFSFLLRLNSTKTSYQATVGSVNVPGVSEIMLEIYDYNSLVIGRYQTVVSFSISDRNSSTTFEILMWRLASLAWLGAASVPFIVLFLLWLIYRKTEEESV